jgi:hypothetical protein
MSVRMLFPSGLDHHSRHEAPNAMYCSMRQIARSEEFRRLHETQTIDAVLADRRHVRIRR